MSSDLFASILDASAPDSPALLASSVPFDVGGAAFSQNTAVSYPAVQWGPSLVLIRDHMSICGGQVGKRQNNCFCLLGLDDGTTKGCQVSKHALLKHPGVTSKEALPTARVYFHKGAGKGVAIAEPWVDAASLSSDELMKLLSKKYPSWKEWKEEAMIYQSAEATRQGLDYVRTTVKATKDMPKPSEMGRVLFKDEEDEDNMLSLESKLATLNSSIKELLQAKMMDWELKPEEEMDEQALVVREVVERLRLIQDAVVSLSEVSMGNLRELQLGLVVRLASLDSILGTFDSLEGTEGFEGTSFAAAAIEYLHEQLEEIRRGDRVRDMVSEVMRSEDRVAFSDSLKEAFKKVMRKFLGLKEEIEVLKNKTGRPGTGLDGTLSMSGSHHDWLGEQIRTQPEGTSGGENLTRLASEGNMQEVIDSLARRVDAMEQNGGMNSKMEGEDISVFFMGVRFSSERDVQTYVTSKSHVAYVLPVGLVTDCYSIFYELNREIFDSKSKLGVTDLAKVAQLAKKQADVYNILAGVEHGLPDFFDPPASATKVYLDGVHGKKHRFGNIPSYEIWGPVGSDGFTIRKKAKGVLARLVTTRKGEIKDQVTDEKLQGFLLQMLDMSKDFVMAVFSFLTEEYAALYQHFDDSALCWDFACSCVEHVFKHEFEAARAVVRNPDVVDDAISIKILWQSLRTIAIQETFMRVGFKNHSSLSSAYSKFLLSQHQKSAAELAKMTKEVEVCRKLCATMSASMEALEKRVRSAEGTANAAQNAIQRMKRGGD
jgi:hypothetical protein